MAKSLGMSDADANAYTANGSTTAKAYNDQKIVGMLFATSKPSEMFSDTSKNATLKTTTTAGGIRYQRISNTDAMKALLSY